MSPFEVLAILISLTAGLAYINFRFIRFTPTIGLLTLALLFSVLLLLSKGFGLPIGLLATEIVSKIDFHDTLMNGMLSSLLFAGALHVELKSLSENKITVGILSSVGLLLSTLIVGVCAYFLFAFFKLNISFLYCLVFGALISPTDPIAVLALLKTSHAPKNISTQIAGESLFNDGVAVVVFIILSRLLLSPLSEITAVDILRLFVVEALGGVALGLLIGFGALALLKTIDDFKIEILLTLAVVTGGYALANRLHTSGPIAMVVAGLLVGNQGRSGAMSDLTRINLNLFWEMIDEILNATLFVLIGLELLIIPFNLDRWLVSLLFVPVALFARWISVGFSFVLARLFRECSAHSVKILTWGGLRGGISVALALSLPEGPERTVILCATYVVVLFAILIQGLTFPKFLRPLIQ
jgi:CPA1 family monovalent cation:H+ antiporter